MHRSAAGTPPVLDFPAGGSERRLVPTRHGLMHVRTLGGGGVPLVLLHMSPFSGRMFATVAPLLARDRLVVVPDRIGFGASDPLDAPIPLEQYAAATLDALDALGLDRFDVVGIHTGSCEAIELAASTDGRVRRIGIVSLPAFGAEALAELDGFRRSPPEADSTGSQLDWYWDWWSEIDVPEVPAWLRHDRAVQHMVHEKAWWTYGAVFDYPTAERVRSLRQPLLVMVPHDDLLEVTTAALGVLPETARVLDLPQLSYEVFTIGADAMAASIGEFLR